MGILPLGTGNDSASLFGVPKDPARAAELIAACQKAGLKVLLV